MFVTIALALLAVIICLAIQIATIGVALRYVVRRRVGASDKRFIGDLFRMSVILISLFLGHFLQISTWACLFLLSGELPDFADAYYYSAVNYTSLGYGDIVLQAPWRLLGPIEAAGGMLMFGLSVSLYFAVLSRMIGRHRDSKSSLYQQKTS